MIELFINFLLGSIFTGILLVIIITVFYATVVTIYQTAGLWWAMCFAIPVVICAVRTVFEKHDPREAFQTREEEQRRHKENREVYLSHAEAMKRFKFPGWNKLD
jgi:Ca2+/Na+ antiporter